MSANTRRSRRSEIHSVVASLRVPLAVWVLFTIAYFVVEYAYGVPYQALSVEWQPDNSAIVTQAMPNAVIISSSTVKDVQPGDVLLAIDGISFQHSELKFRFGPVADFHTYALRRGNEEFTARIDSGQPNLAEQVELLLPGIVGLEAWLVGFLIILFAPTDDEVAWLAGFVTWGLALALTGATALQAGIPGSRLAYTTLLPIMSVGYVEMAFLPGSTSGRADHKIAFRALYGIAAVLSVLALIEAFLLFPGSSWTAITGVPLLTVMAVILAIALLAAPVAMAVRFVRLPPDHADARRQIKILLAGTGLALLPFVGLTLIPEILGLVGLPWEVTLPLLGMVPATYGYVIYRHRFLNLDLYVSRSLTLLLAAFIVSGLYTVGIAALRQFPPVASLDLAFGMAILLVGFAVVGLVGDRLRRILDAFLHGERRQFDQVLQKLTVELALDPQVQTLTKILLGTVPDLLEVRQAALFLVDKNAVLTPIGQVRVADLSPRPQAELDGLPNVLLRQSSPEAGLFNVFPWAHLAMPLMFRTNLIGLLLLGEKVPDGHFDGAEVSFLQQLVAAAAITAESAKLFESLQEISQDLLRVRAAERIHLSARLHDEPLQRAAAVVRNLDNVIASLPADNDLTFALDRQKGEVRQLATELREICAGLRPPILDQGLRLTLRHVVDSFRAQAQALDVRLVIPDDPEPTLPSEGLDAAYHVVTESLNNVQKYAQATRVSVGWRCTPRAVEISIVDDGIGTKLAGLSLPELVRGHHFGIVGMHQWASMAHGQLHMRSADPQGTIVELMLPVDSTLSHPASAVSE